jgi:hypothetical protein
MDISRRGRRDRPAAGAARTGRLPPVPEIADKVDLGVRFEFLDIVMMFDRGWLGLRSLEALSAGRRLAKGPEPEMNRFGKNINWDPAMPSANKWFDRLVAALRIKNRAAQKKEWRQVRWGFGTLRVRVAVPDYRTKLFLALGSTKTRSEYLGDLMLALSMPAMGKVQNAADRTRQVH